VTHLEVESMSDWSEVANHQMVYKVGSNTGKSMEEESVWNGLERF